MDDTNNNNNNNDNNDNSNDNRKDKQELGVDNNEKEPGDDNKVKMTTKTRKRHS
jgi:hypothetical protein